MTMTAIMSRLIAGGQHPHSKTETKEFSQLIKQESRVFVGLEESGIHSYGLTESSSTYTQEMISLRRVALVNQQKLNTDFTRITGERHE